MKYLFAVRENCTGCRACEYACSLKHEGVVRPSAARIHVTKYASVVDVPVICWHCDDSPCIHACPTTPTAIKKDPETGAIKHIDDKTCLGAKCNKCIEACPAGYLRRNPDGPYSVIFATGIWNASRPVRNRPEIPRTPVEGGKAGIRR